jgi:phospholipid N-methyltransferase
MPKARKKLEMEQNTAWEKPYMEAWVNILKPHGDVLEIGFGSGWTSSYIADHKPKSQTIIEANPAIAKKAKTSHPKFKIIEGEWQEQLSKLGTFDTIFSDSYTRYTKGDVASMKSHIKKIQARIAELEKMKQGLAAQLKKFAGIPMSDQQLDDLKQHIDQRGDVTPTDIHSFLETLVLQKNITFNQAKNFLKKYKIPLAAPTEPAPASFLADPFLLFVHTCLNHHMKKGSRLSCYVNLAAFKEWEVNFKNYLLARGDIRYEERTVAVEVPSDCDYCAGNQALFFVIEKK